ncbi:peptidyl-prolyl cis-trans isomerase [bacterium]|nr:peptidyl-prolyl cis-trans isomerase [bacterium]
MRKLLLLIILLMFTSCAKEVRIDSPIIAKVENTVLTLADAERLKLAVPNQNYSLNDAVASWVDRELLYLAAEQGGLESDVTLNSQVSVYRKDLFGNTFMDNYVASQISIESTEIKTYYDKNRDSFRHQNDGAKIMHFFITTDSVAKHIADALKQTNNSLDRKELLANYDVDVTTVERGNLIEQLDSDIFSNNRTNIIIGPVKTDYGYHVIEVLGRYKAGSQIAIDEAYDEIYQRLFNQKKALRSMRFLDSLRNHYTVKINLEND